jgi:hypothetical protein
MRKIPHLPPAVAFVAVAVVCGGSVLPVRAEENDRAAALKFLKAHVIGKTVRAEDAVERAADGKSETVVSDACTYGNLAETAHGFRFDLTQVIGRTAYELKDGRRVEPGRRTEIAAVFRYELIQRGSTGRLTGSDVVASTSDPAAYTPGQAYAVRFELKDGALAITESTVDYEDIEIDGKPRPGVYVYQERLSVKDGKLHKEETLSTYTVDPASGKRTPHGKPEEKVWRER